ncbi:hypothetical protein DLAC_01778 [Tieghemostelium lacteum]|uniref:Uncharacterized protein n=1 Tax=Tieghemostelium lacteum TaxID=361077 RepID=A0A152A6A4_TIELA|nr:hypothetical protein DLAC_01778 [Tieghemostelium lacteum]|eukprot:KYR01766.1 hypothetical protein DLAC_01778 [Tieghemostelium lacteum]
MIRLNTIKNVYLKSIRLNFRTNNLSEKALILPSKNNSNNFESNQKKQRSSSRDKSKQGEEKQNKKEQEWKKRDILFSLSFFGLFGGKKEEENPYAKESGRVKGSKINSHEDALDWYQRYYQHRDPDQFIQGIILLLGSESKEFILSQLRHIRVDKDFKTISHIQIIQSFYYLPLVGFISEVFRQNPQKVAQWYQELSTNDQIKTPWKSTFGELDPMMLLNLAVSITNIPETKQIERQIVLHSLQSLSPKPVTEEELTDNLSNLSKWAKNQTSSISTLPLILIGEYFANGNEENVKKISNVWKNALTGLERLMVEPEKNSNDKVKKQLDIQQMEILIDELNQAIRLLIKDKKASEILNIQLSTYIKSQKA